MHAFGFGRAFDAVLLCEAYLCRSKVTVEVRTEWEPMLCASGCIACCLTLIVLGCSKALLMFEDDPRFLAVDKDRDREELFEDYTLDLERKVRSIGWSMRKHVAFVLVANRWNAG